MGRRQQTTPMMRQYRRVKAQHPDKIVLFHLGDFYEMFEADAKTGAALLGLTLTSRQGVPMAGIPVHAAGNYIKRLLAAGQKVVICDQLEDPKQAKGLVKRDVTRIITPGTILEEEFLEASRNNYLLALAGDDNAVALVWADLSTGEVAWQDAPAAELSQHLSRIEPAEVLLAEDAQQPAVPQDRLTHLPAYLFDAAAAEDRLMRHYELATLDGLALSAAAVRALGALVAYLEETQQGKVPALSRPRPAAAAANMLVDAGCLRNLEILEGAGGRSGSLLSVLGAAVTAVGKRLLRRWLAAPAAALETIHSRHHIVRFFKQQPSVRQRLRGLLGRVQDVERLSSRLACARATPRDLAALACSAALFPEVKALFAGHELPPPLAELMAAIEPLEAFTGRVLSVLTDEPPAQLADGDCIRAGADTEVDRLRALRNDAHGWLSHYQAELVRCTGIQSLKVGYNRVFGYYIEVSRSNLKRVPAEFERRQTLTAAERFVTPELKKFESDMLTAEERLKAREEQLFGQLRGEVAVHVPALRLNAALLAQLDVLAGFAEVAEKRRYVEPQMLDEPVIEIFAGRHPVVEAALAPGGFVPNDTALDAEKAQIMVLTGPNMSGKSTYIRQVALIALMAQCGAFVPAEKARLGVFDRLFARVGAADDISGGKSTFMVEMVEAARILNAASNRSLVILDEVGRGTSTFDGLSLAWAVVEYLHESEHTRPITLFATHYHELTAMAREFRRIRNYNVAVREWQGQPVFLHQIVAGGMDRSYGIHVARLAGVPQPVIKRAESILGRLEEHAEELRERTLPGKGPRVRQLALFAPARSKVVEELLRLAPERMTPVEASQALEHLRKIAEKETRG